MSGFATEGLEGSRFGLLDVMAEAEPYLWRGTPVHRRWACRCDCGAEAIVRQDSLITGHTRSCGCEKVRVTREIRTRHEARAEGRRTPEYNVWQHLLRQARRRGLVIPPRWQRAQGFESFLADVGRKPDPASRLQCEPGRSGRRAAHWRWVADAPRRGVPRRLIAYRGRVVALRELAELTGLSYAALAKRLERGQKVAPGAEPLPTAAPAKRRRRAAQRVAGRRRQGAKHAPRRSRSR